MKEELPERYFYSRNKIAMIGQVLKEIFPKRNVADKAYQKVKNAWLSVVDERIRKCTEVYNLKDRVLYVGVESSVMIHHLTNFEKLAIINKINEIVGSKCIENIRFKAGKNE